MPIQGFIKGYQGIQHLRNTSHMLLTPCEVLVFKQYLTCTLQHKHTCGAHQGTILKGQEHWIYTNVAEMRLALKVKVHSQP